MSKRTKSEKEKKKKYTYLEILKETLYESNTPHPPKKGNISNQGAYDLIMLLKIHSKREYVELKNDHSELVMEIRQLKAKIKKLRKRMKRKGIEEEEEEEETLITPEHQKVIKENLELKKKVGELEMGNEILRKSLEGISIIQQQQQELQQQQALQHSKPKNPAKIRLNSSGPTRRASFSIKKMNEMRKQTRSKRFSLINKSLFTRNKEVDGPDPLSSTSLSLYLKYEGKADNIGRVTRKYSLFDYLLRFETYSLLLPPLKNKVIKVWSDKLVGGTFTTSTQFCVFSSSPPPSMKDITEFKSNLYLLKYDLYRDFSRIEIFRVLGSSQFVKFVDIQKKSSMPLHTVPTITAYEEDGRFFLIEYYQIDEFGDNNGNDDDDDDDEEEDQIIDSEMDNLFFHRIKVTGDKPKIKQTFSGFQFPYYHQVVIKPLDQKKESVPFLFQYLYRDSYQKSEIENVGRTEILFLEKNLMNDIKNDDDDDEASAVCVDGSYLSDVSYQAPTRRELVERFGEKEIISYSEEEQKIHITDLSNISKKKKGVMSGICPDMVTCTLDITQFSVKKIFSFQNSNHFIVEDKGGKYHFFCKKRQIQMNKDSTMRKLSRRFSLRRSTSGSSQSNAEYTFIEFMVPRKKREFGEIIFCYEDPLTKGRLCVIMKGCPNYYFSSTLSYEELRDDVETPKSDFSTVFRREVNGGLHFHDVRVIFNTNENFGTGTRGKGRAMSVGVRMLGYENQTVEDVEINWDSVDKYEGGWNQKKQRHGRGVLYFKNGDRYEGGWWNDKMCGDCTFYYESGAKFSGKCKNGKAYGKGTFIYSNGDKYHGDYEKSLRCGQGTLVLKSGDRYEGYWKDDVYHGHGKFVYSLGSYFMYEGEWEYGVKSGSGVFKYFNGDVFKGDWVNDKREGQGILTKRNGDQLTQIWKNGVLGQEFLHRKEKKEKIEKKRKEVVEEKEEEEESFSGF